MSKGLAIHQLLEKVAALEAEIHALQAGATRANELIKELADDLDSEIRARYQGYPDDDRRFLRDLIIVSEARAYLKAAEIADEVCAQSKNHLFRSGAKVVAGNIRAAAEQPSGEAS